MHVLDAHGEHALDALRARARDARVDRDLVLHLSSARRIFGSVIRFMCGHRLQGRINSTSG